MRAAPLLAALLALAACADADGPAVEAPPSPPPEAAVGSSLGVSDGYARAAPEGGVSAVFFRVENGTGTADTLVAARTDVAGRVEVHETTEGADGLRGMRPVAGVPVPAGGAVAFEPGGLHVMLLDLQRDLDAGETVPVELDFAGGRTLTLDAPVRGLE